MNQSKQLKDYIIVFITDYLYINFDMFLGKLMNYYHCVLLSYSITAALFETR